MTKCIKLQYVGDPIVCLHNDMKDHMDYAKQYCWLHGSNRLPTDYQNHLTGGKTCQVMLNRINYSAARI